MSTTLPWYLSDANAPLPCGHVAPTAPQIVLSETTFVTCPTCKREHSTPHSVIEEMNRTIEREPHTAECPSAREQDGQRDCIECENEASEGSQFCGGDHCKLDGRSSCGCDIGFCSCYSREMEESNDE